MDDKSIRSFATSITWDQEGQGERSKEDSCQEQLHDPKNLDTEQNDGLTQENPHLKSIGTLDCHEKKTLKLEKELCALNQRARVDPYDNSIDESRLEQSASSIHSSKTLRKDHEFVHCNKELSNHKTEINAYQDEMEQNIINNSNLLLPKSDAASESKQTSSQQLDNGSASHPSHSHSSEREDDTSHSIASTVLDSYKDQVQDRDVTNNDDEDSYGSSDFDEETVLKQPEEKITNQIENDDDKSLTDSCPIDGFKSHSSSQHALTLPEKDTIEKNSMSEFPVSSTTSATSIPIDMSNYSITETTKNGESLDIGSTGTKDTRTELSYPISSSISSPGIEVSKPTTSNPSNMNNWW